MDNSNQPILLNLDYLRITGDGFDCFLFLELENCIGQGTFSIVSVLGRRCAVSCVSFNNHLASLFVISLWGPSTSISTMAKVFGLEIGSNPSFTMSFSCPIFSFSTSVSSSPSSSPSASTPHTKSSSADSSLTPSKYRLILFIRSHFTETFYVIIFVISNSYIIQYVHTLWPSGPIFGYSRTLFTSFLFTWRILHVFVLVLQPQAAKSCLKPSYMKCFSYHSIYWLSISFTFGLEIHTLKMVFVNTFPVTWVHNHRNYVLPNKSSIVKS